jgi:hypothetical protein
MGITYDTAKRKWSYTNEKTDYSADNKTDYDTNKPTNLPTDHKALYDSWKASGGDSRLNTIKGSVEGLYVNYLGRYPSTSEVDHWRKHLVDNHKWVPNTGISSTELNILTPFVRDSKEAQKKQDTYYANSIANVDNAKSNEMYTTVNLKNEQENKESLAENTKNEAKNLMLANTLWFASNTKGGDYVSNRQGILTQSNAVLSRAGVTADEIKKFNDVLVGNYKLFYLTEKLKPWDSEKLGAKPPYGAFDVNYYKTQNPSAARQWAEAVAIDDIDITQRYGEDNFYLQHYTTQGKPAGLRGNPVEGAKAANEYLEKTPTDKDLQDIRSLQLGESLVGVALGEEATEKAISDVTRFSKLTQDVLKQTIDEMTKVKAREQDMAVFKGLGTFNEIVDINKELSNSILGDSGIGGVLSFMGGSKTQESLEKSLAKVTGVNTNNTSYNWQKWFDETLKTKYDQNLELGYTTDEAKEQAKSEAAFAKTFIDKYLTPRFNTSRSMDEFVEYLDVSKSEQNPFQTQDAMNAAKLIGDIRTKAYLDQLKATPGRSFDFNFYFNPTGNKARVDDYAKQAATVEADWEAAKKGDEYWKSQAYRFGVDVKDKNAFARMHFEVKGRGEGYDPAEDILNPDKVADYIYTQIVPAVKEEFLKSGSVFGQFITPEEFADVMLRGLDPNDRTTWDELLKRYGIDDFKGNIDELKEYVKETLRTGSAQEIREGINYLNEKGQKPTQENLGVTYIERAEDYKNKEIKGETELYKTFQSAGFKGTEDEFYNDFFPDMDRSEQVLLTKSGKNEGLKTSGLDFKDPFASLGTIESFFDADEPKETTDKPEPKTNSYFRIAMDEDEDEPTTKSKSGASILGEFTSMFKGF